MLPHITIRLVGQQNDRLWELIKVDPEIHVEELVNLIQTLTRIPPNFQQIEFRGERLPTVEHPLQTIKFGEELVVSHNHLIYWKTFLEMIEEIRKMTTSGATSARREIADRAQEQLAILRYSKFFHVYSSLSFEELKISCNLNFLVYNTKKYLDRSVLAYFEALYPKRKVELKDKTKNFAGIHLGVFVLVDGVASHYAKTLGDIPGIEEDINCIMIDSIEIFVYILLKLIGLGAEEVHVIPEVNKDEWVFIATKLIDGFRTASGVSVNDSEEEKKVEINEEMKKEMRILSSLICLNDLLRNEGNHGVVEMKTTEDDYELRIVDFGIDIASIFDEPAVLKSNISSLNEYLEKWDILNNIYKAKETMENDPALKNNPNVNKKAFDRYFERLETALKTFLNK